MVPKMPFWRFYLNQGDVVTEPLSDAILICANLLLQCEDFDWVVAEDLINVVKCCHAYFINTEQVEKAYEVVDKLLCVQCYLLCSGNLEKRVMATTFLSRQADLYMAESRYGKDFLLSAGTKKFPDLLLEQLHVEVVNRSYSFMRWACKADLVSPEVLQTLWTAILQSHETIRVSVFKLLQNAMMPFFSETLKNAMKVELQRSNATLLDDFSIDCLKYYLGKVLTGDAKQEFGLILLEKLQDLGEGQGKSGVSTVASILASPMFLDRAKEIFLRKVEMLRQLGSREDAAEFLSLFLKEISKNSMRLRELLKSESSFLDTCIAIIESRAIDESKRVVIRLLECIVCVSSLNLGNDSSSSELTPTHFSRLWNSLVTAETPQLRITFLTFIHECESRWLDDELVGEVLEQLDKLTDKTLLLLTHLRKEEYEGLYTIFIAGNQRVFEAYCDSFTFRSHTVPKGLKLLTACPVVIEDINLRKTSTKRLFNFLTVNDLRKNIPSLRSVECLFTFITPQSLYLHNALTLLDDFVRYEAKYRTVSWHYEDFVDYLEELKEEKPHWLEIYPKERLLEVMEPYIKKMARKDGREVPFFCVKFKDNPESDVPYTISASFTHLDFSCFFEYPQHLKALFQILKENVPSKDSILTWTIVTRLLPFSQFLSRISKSSKDYTQYQQSGDFVDRLLWLQAISQLSSNPTFERQFRESRRDIMELFRNLKFESDPAHILAHFKYKFVVYCEVLVHLVEIYFWAKGEETGPEEVEKTLEILTFVAEYFTMPDMDMSLTTKIFDSATLLLSAQKSLDYFDESLEFLIHLCLFQSLAQHFRASSAAFFVSICRKNYDLKNTVLIALVENVKTAVEMKQDSLEFFQLCVQLIKSEEIEDPAPFSPFLQSISLKVQTDASFWTENAEVRKAVLDLVGSLRKLMSIEMKRGLVETTVRWLFSFKEQYIVKDVTQRAVKEAYDLLFSLGNDDPDTLSCILDLLSGFHRQRDWRKRHRKWWDLTFSPQALKPRIGFKNLGATCYLASIFQQLFAVDSFREGIFSLEDGNQSLLLQEFIKTFVKLKHKCRGSVSPELILSFYNQGEEPIDPLEQMDIDEFLNGFMQKLEADLTCSRQSNIVKDHFKGKLLTTLKCRGCQEVRELSQEFLTLTLGIKGKKNMTESLETMIRGELLSGDNAIQCSVCKSSQPTESIQRIQLLPKVLICSLRRFDYSIERGARHKINDFYEFPQELDLRSYCVTQDFPDDYYTYKLKGVVIHLGMAEAGHYYSLIKYEDKWIRFDDQVVEEGGIDLEKEAFGNRQRTYGNGANGSAYLIVYERTHCYEFNDVLSRPNLLDPSPVDCSLQVQSRIEDLNTKLRLFWQLQQLLSPSYSLFISRLLNSPGLSIQTLKFIIAYFLSIHCRNSAWTQNCEVISKMLEKINENTNVSMWMIEVMSHPGMLEEFLISCPVDAVKKAYVLLFHAALTSASIDAAVNLGLSRMIWKMESFADLRSKDLAQFFEIMLKAVRRISTVAVELQLADRLISRLLNIELEIAPVPERKQMFHQDAYLGHPWGEYTTTRELSRQSYCAFQFMILDVCLTSESLQSFAEFLVRGELVRQYVLNTLFERKQFAKFLLSCYRIDQQIVHQLISSWTVILLHQPEDILNSFFDVSRILVNATNGELLEVTLSALIEDCLAKLPSWYMLPIWINQLHKLYVDNPHNEIWGNVKVKNMFKSWEEALENTNEEVLRRLMALIAGDATTVEPFKYQEEDFYDKQLVENTSLLVTVQKQKKVGRVVKSFKVAHVLKFTNQTQLVWVSAEDDMKAS